MVSAKAELISFDYCSHLEGIFFCMCLSMRVYVCVCANNTTFYFDEYTWKKHKQSFSQHRRNNNFNGKKFDFSMRAIILLFWLKYKFISTSSLYAIRALLLFLLLFFVCICLNTNFCLFVLRKSRKREKGTQRFTPLIKVSTYSNIILIYKFALFINAGNNFFRQFWTFKLHWE